MNNRASRKLSIVTICYNSKKFIESTFESVRNQTDKNFEYVVIDGGSTDGTLGIIKNNEDIIDHWYSEPDDGIADAMNKGIEKSTGDYIIFLHSDDYFVDHESTEKVLKAVVSGKDIVVFDVYVETEIGRSIPRTRKFNFYTKIKQPFCHQGVVCKRRLFDDIGVFDTNFDITMDYDFFLRAYYLNASCLIISTPLSVFRNTGISSREDWEGLSERLGEEKEVHLKNCKSHRMRLLYRIWWFLYPLYRRFRYAIPR